MLSGYMRSKVTEGFAAAISNALMVTEFSLCFAQILQKLIHHLDGWPTMCRESTSCLEQKRLHKELENIGLL